MNKPRIRRDIDLNLLRVFEAVVRERHLTRAADALALTPSAVSHALGRLREYLDDPLFVRQGTSMLPTPACERLAPELLETLARLRLQLQKWGRFDPLETRQTFRVGIPDAVELMLLPALQRLLSQRAPLASLASMAFERPNVPQMLAVGQLDAVIDVALPIRAPVRHQPLLEDDFCVIARKGGPLKRRPTLAQYLAAEHIAVSGRSQGLVLEDHALSAQGLERRVVLRCQNYISAFRALSGCDHLLTVPSRMGRDLGEAYGLRAWVAPFRVPPMQLHLYWHAGNHEDKANRWLRQLLADAVAARA